MSDMWWASLGQWRAYFLEPMLVFIMLVGRIRKGVTMAPVDAAGRVSINDLILFLALSTIPVSLVALAQKFTGALYPPSLWDDSLGGRVTSFFTSPNAVGLYLGPLLLLTLGLIWQRSKRRWLFIVYCLLFIANLAALLFTKSLGAWIAVGIGLILFTYLIGYKKTTLTALVASAALIISVLPSFSLAKSQSLANRLTLWRYSWSYLTESPKNFLFGTGLRQFFRKIQKPHYDAKELERLIYPHNIFLNFWTEIGLLGLVGFLGLYFSLLVTSYSLYKHSDKILGATLLATLLAILIHGLIDVPYFKNDLAFVFWIIATIIMGTATAQQKSLAKIG
ncbi:MAG: O-antigen ligase family protein [Candidatus Magasanikbacteria bacterium]|nr:O-antigen ligase family protein [Candidatus Magasanikbacteria bacterium]